MLFGLVYLFAACSQINDEVFANWPLRNTKPKETEAKSILIDSETQSGQK